LPEETKTPLQEQIDADKKLVDRSPLIVLVLGILSMLSVGLTIRFGEPVFGLVCGIGFLIAMTSTAFSAW
jgi:nitrate reductase NapE component